MADKRRHKWYRQCKKFGFDDRDTWSLFTTISVFVLPRLKRFRSVAAGYPSDLTQEEWNGLLDKMIFAMDFLANEDEINLKRDVPIEEYRKVQEGCELFGKWFRDLWW